MILRTYILLLLTSLSFFACQSTRVESAASLVRSVAPEPVDGCPFYPSQQHLVKAELDAEQCSTPISVFVMEKTGCYGICPAFRIELFSDRTLLFQGLRHTEKIGDHWTRLTSTEYQTLFDKLEALEQNHLAAQYPTQGLLLPDLPQTNFSWQTSHGTMDILANYEVPKVLKDFEAWVTHYLGEEVWRPFT